MRGMSVEDMQSKSMLHVPCSLVLPAVDLLPPDPREEPPRVRFSFPRVAVLSAALLARGASELCSPPSSPPVHGKRSENMLPMVLLISGHPSKRLKAALGGSFKHPCLRRHRRMNHHVKLQSPTMPKHHDAAKLLPSEHIPSKS